MCGWVGGVVWCWELGVELGVGREEHKWSDGCGEGRGDRGGFFLLVGDLLDRAREVGNGECAGEGRVGSGSVCGEATQGHWDRSEEFGPTGRDSAHVGCCGVGWMAERLGSWGEQRIFFAEQTQTEFGVGEGGPRKATSCVGQDRSGKDFVLCVVERGEEKEWREWEGVWRI